MLGINCTWLRTRTSAKVYRVRRADTRTLHPRCPGDTRVRQQLSYWQVDKCRPAPYKCAAGLAYNAGRRNWDAIWCIYSNRLIIGAPPLCQMSQIRRDLIEFTDIARPRHFDKSHTLTLRTRLSTFAGKFRKFPSIWGKRSLVFSEPTVQWLTDAHAYVSLCHSGGSFVFLQVINFDPSRFRLSNT